MPRLELCAALTGAQLAKLLHSELTESISTLKFEEGTGELKSGFCSLFSAWRPPLSLVLRARPA